MQSHQSMFPPRGFQISEACASGPMQRSRSGSFRSARPRPGGGTPSRSGFYLLLALRRRGGVGRWETGSSRGFWGMRRRGDFGPGGVGARSGGGRAGLNGEDARWRRSGNGPDGDGPGQGGEEIRSRPCVGMLSRRISGKPTGAPSICMQ